MWSITPVTITATRWPFPATKRLFAAMRLFRQLILIAVIAGVGVGVVTALLHEMTTAPLVIAAEALEGAAADSGHGHDHGDGWAPGEGLPRQLYNIAAHVVGAIGFALLLLVASELAGGLRDGRHGVLWGLAGFASVTLAPGLGLPAELPGMPAADLTARQLWWLATALATAGGLALIVLTRRLPFALLGVGLLALPHGLGAPPTPAAAAPALAALHLDFAVWVLVVGLVFWAALGGALGLLRGRLLRPRPGAAPALGN